MKLIYNRFSLIPHTCSKCEKAFWLAPYKRYKVERFSMFGNIEYVTNICKECATRDLPDFESNLIVRIENERDKVNAEGEMVYSKSEIEVFNKCIRIFQGEE